MQQRMQELLGLLALGVAGLLVLGFSLWNSPPAIIAAMNNYVDAANTNDPVDVTAVVARSIPIGAREADVTADLKADGFELVRNRTDRYYWNIDDDTGSQYYLGFEQVRHKQIISTRTYIVEVGIKDGTVCWEHAGVVGQSL